MKNIFPFHLAIPVDDLSKAIDFYENVLDCPPGRKSDHWADYNFFGHQLVVHVDPKHNSIKHHNKVDGKSVPVPHFGVVLSWGDFDLLAKKLEDSEQIEFTIPPYLRFEGFPGEQKTLFFYDPAGNALEFKSFKNIDQLFKS